MKVYILRQTSRTVLVLFLITLLVFSLVYFWGSDIYWGPPLTAESFQRLELILGLDGKSFPEAYVSWMGAMLRGDWGTTPWDYSGIAE